MLLLEKLRKEFSEIDAPVLPDVSFGSLVIFVVVALFIKYFAVFFVGLVEEVVFAYGNPV